MSKTISIFDPNVCFHGVIYGDCSIENLGEIRGTIIVNKLVVKNNGKIKGDAFASSMLMVEEGFIEGNITAKSIRLSKGAFISGNLFYETIMIEDGAVVCGNITKIDQETLKKSFDEAIQRSTVENSNIVTLQNEKK